MIASSVITGSPIRILASSPLVVPYRRPPRLPGRSGLALSEAVIEGLHVYFVCTGEPSLVVRSSGPRSCGSVKLKGMVFFNQSVEAPREPDSGARPGPGGKSGIWSWLLLALLVILGFFCLRALRRFDTELVRLSQRNEEFSRRLATVEQRSQAAAQEAAQAAQSARAARYPEKPGGRCSGQI